MSFAEFMIVVPPWARLLLALAITIGITVAAIWLLHGPILRLDKDPRPDSRSEADAADPNESAETGSTPSGTSRDVAAATATHVEGAEPDGADGDGADGDGADGDGADGDGADLDRPDGNKGEGAGAEGAKGTAAKGTGARAEGAKDTEGGDKPPEAVYLAGMVRGMAATAFVFLLAFALGNFWGNANDARSASMTEQADYTRALTLARAVPASAGGAQVVGALESYRATVVDVEWPLMQRADADAAYRVQAGAADDLGAALLNAEQAGISETPEWSALSSAIDDMLDQALSRIAQVPSPFAPAVLLMVGILAVANLAITSMYQPARLGHQLFLMSVMAGITALLLFVVVEASNPFVGAAAVQPTSMAGPSAVQSMAPSTSVAPLTSVAPSGASAQR